MLIDHFISVLNFEKLVLEEFDFFRLLWFFISLHISLVKEEVVHLNPPHGKAMVTLSFGRIRIRLGLKSLPFSEFFG